MNTTSTSIARAMRASDIRRHRDGYDRACKRLLSEKEILGWILHECLVEFKEVSPSDIASTYIEGDPEIAAIPLHADDAAAMLVSAMNSEDTSLDEGTVWYDIRFRALVPHTSEHVGMIVNVEAQGDFTPGYPLLKRAAYYCGRMLSSQYGRVFSGSHYEKVQKVCSIWVCPYPSPAYRNTVTRYSMTEQNLVGSVQASRSEYDLIEIILACPDGDRQHEGDGILRLLGTLLASERSVDERKAIISSEFGIPMTQRLSEEVTEVGSWLSKGLEERAYERGHKEGRADGFKQGIEQGIEQGVERGVEQGKVQERELMAKLALFLQDQGRFDELSVALLEEAKLHELLVEAGLEE